MEESEQAAELAPTVQEVGISELGISFKAGITWAVDDSDASHLWHLKQSKSKDWFAERFEYLAQVSSFACGPEHQVAVTTYTVPACRDEEVGVSSSGQVRSLQQMCEDKLCAKLNPRSFGLVCDIAWELNRPELLDRAFSFLCANAPLMFSRLHLPTLSQLPVEVLAAFEMAAKAKCSLRKASELSDEVDESDFQMDPILRETKRLCETGQWSRVSSQALSLLATSMPGTAAGEGPLAESLGLSFALSEIEDAQMEAEPEKDPRPKRRASQSSPNLTKQASPAMSSKSSPKSSAVSPALQEQKSPLLEAQDWVEVKNAKRKNSDSKPLTPKVKASDSPLVPPSPKTIVPPSPKTVVPPSPKGSGRSASGRSEGKGSKTLMSIDDSGGRHLRLADFMPGMSRKGKGKEAKKPETKTESGPSAILVSAVASVGKEGRAGAAWGSISAERSSPLSEILEGQSVKRSSRVGAPKAKVLSCSWGRDALPSEQPKNQSITEIQQEEELLREHDEILEIEAWNLFFPSNKISMMNLNDVN